MDFPEFPVVAKTARYVSPRDVHMGPYVSNISWPYAIDIWMK